MTAQTKEKIRVTILGVVSASRVTNQDPDEIILWAMGHIIKALQEENE